LLFPPCHATFTRSFAFHHTQLLPHCGYHTPHCTHCYGLQLIATHCTHPAHTAYTPHYCTFAVVPPLCTGLSALVPLHHSLHPLLHITQRRLCALRTLYTHLYTLAPPRAPLVATAPYQVAACHWLGYVHLLVARTPLRYLHAQLHHTATTDCPQVTHHTTTLRLRACWIIRTTIPHTYAYALPHAQFTDSAAHTHARRAHRGLPCRPHARSTLDCA